jgi:enoyl-CoA hydratase/carnithine racemase
MDEPTSTSATGYDLRDGLATIVLPTASLGTASKVWLRDALVRAGADDAVRAVVLTGSGKAFCVGQDLGEHAEALAADRGSAFDTLEQHYEPIINALTTMPKPALAAVNGACVGAGLSIILASRGLRASRRSPGRSCGELAPRDLLPEQGGWREPLAQRVAQVLGDGQPDVQTHKIC